MQAIKIITYLILGVIPATFLCLLMMATIIAEPFTYPSILPLLGTIGLWLATFDFLFESRKVNLAIAMLLLAGVTAMVPMTLQYIKAVFMNDLESGLIPDAFSIVDLVSSLIQFALFVSPVLIAIHYIWDLYSGCVFRRS